MTDPLFNDYPTANLTVSTNLVVGSLNGVWNPLINGALSWIPGNSAPSLNPTKSLKILSTNTYSLGAPWNSSGGIGWTVPGILGGSYGQGLVSLPEFISPKVPFNLSPTSGYPPSVPASGTAQQNPYPIPVEIYLNGGAVTQVTRTVNGTSYTVFSSSTGEALSGHTVRLDPGDSITLTYTTAPTWSWAPA